MLKKNQNSVRGTRSSCLQPHGRSHTRSAQLGVLTCPSPYLSIFINILHMFKKYAILQTEKELQITD